MNQVSMLRSTRGLKTVCHMYNKNAKGFCEYRVSRALHVATKMPVLLVVGVRVNATLKWPMAAGRISPSVLVRGTRTATNLGAPQKVRTFVPSFVCVVSDHRFLFPPPVSR